MSNFPPVQGILQLRHSVTS